MTNADAAALWAAGNHPEVWVVSPRRMLSAGDMESYVDAAMAERTAGSALPFVITVGSTGEVLGSTRFGNISRANRRVEIGWTWLTPAWQRTSANTESKLLMLGHAFDAMRCIRVEFKTDALNVQSRTAILRIGALEEGVLRSHVITAAGRRRDTVYYSILDDEWASVREHLTDRLARG